MSDRFYPCHCETEADGTILKCGECFYEEEISTRTAERDKLRKDVAKIDDIAVKAQVENIKLKSRVERYRATLVAASETVHSNLCDVHSKVESHHWLCTEVSKDIDPVIAGEEGRAG